MTIELHSDLIDHKLCHLILDRRALGCCCNLLTLRRLLAKALHRALVGRLGTRQITCQQTMHHHIGIATNGRCEMRIIWERQTVMANVVGGIERL